MVNAATILQMSACVGRASLVRLTTACCRTSRTLSTSAARAGARQDQVQQKRPTHL